MSIRTVIILKISPNSKALMPSLIDHLAALTNPRDRQSLDLALTTALMDLIQPKSVALYSVVNDAINLHWFPLIVMMSGGVTRVGDPLRADFRLLPPLQAFEHRQKCLESRLLVEREVACDEGGWTSCLPLFAPTWADEIGIVEIYSKHRLSESSQDIVARLLYVYRNMSSIFAVSEQDALTGLLNRKSFDDTFYKLLADSTSVSVDESMSGESDEKDVRSVLQLRRKEAGERFWLAMVDIDHFKRVNDGFGHQIGDEVLILVARSLKKSFRGSDRIYRFGGEEFVIILRAPDDETVVQIAERFRKQMEASKFPQVGSLTASMGVAEVLPGDSPSTVCEKADQALYYAKNNGRNQVCSHADLFNLGLLQKEVKVSDIDLF